MPLNEMLEFTKDEYGTTVTAKPGITSCFLPSHEGVFTFPMSLETNYCPNTIRIYFPFKCTIAKIRTVVTKALAADDATITCGNSTGASAGGVVTIAGSAALVEEDSATPTTNNTIAVDSYYYLTSAKATKGGEILVSLEYLRTE